MNTRRILVLKQPNGVEMWCDVDGDRIVNTIFISHEEGLQVAVPSDSSLTYMIEAMTYARDYHAKHEKYETAAEYRDIVENIKKGTDA